MYHKTHQDTRQRAKWLIVIWWEHRTLKGAVMRDLLRELDAGCWGYVAFVVLFALAAALGLLGPLG